MLFATGLLERLGGLDASTSDVVRDAAALPDVGESTAGVPVLPIEDLAAAPVAEVAGVSSWLGDGRPAGELVPHELVGPLLSAAGPRGGFATDLVADLFLL